MRAQASQRKNKICSDVRTILAFSCFLSLIAAVHATDDDAARTAAANLTGANLHSLPISNGNITTAGPRANYVFVCTMGPLNEGRRGAQHAGSWIHNDGTFDASAKPQVEGNVDWQDHKLTIAVHGDKRSIYTNDLPDVSTGVFPIEPGTEAYKYDTNPNSIQVQNLKVAVSAQPMAADKPSCLPPGGPIGILLTGAELYNSLDAGGRNAVAYEIQDHCWGHPQRNGSYHYHSLTPCMDLGDKNGTSPLLGYALDGFGIYGPYENGKLLTNKDLDECHGKTSAILWEGTTVVMYHYVANFEYPFTLGCYQGVPVRLPPDGRPPFGGPGGPRDDRPPPPGR
jgi:hypothetical protein